MALTLILIVFGIVVFLCFLEESLEKYKTYVYIAICMILILYAGFREVGLDRDSESYEYLFYSSDNPLAILFVEPSFLLISSIASRMGNDVHGLFLIYAMLGVSLKFIAIRRLSPVLFLPIAIYISDFYVLHDMTQIRAGVASAIFLMSLKPLHEGRKRRAALYMAAGIFFHYSSLILFPLLLFGNKDLTFKWKIALAAIPVIGIGMYIANFDILLSLPIPYIQEKLESYRKLSDFGYYDRSSIMPPFMFIKICMFYYCLWFCDTIKQFLPSVNIILKIMGMSIIAYYALSYVTILGQRCSELYGIVEVLLYASAIYTIIPQYVGKVYVIFITLVMTFYSYVYWDLLYF